MAEFQSSGDPSWWRRHWLVLVLSAVGLILLLAYVVLAVTVLPGWIVSVSGAKADENHRLDAIVNTRGALLGVLAPVVVAIGAVAAFLNYRVAARNLADTADQNRRTYELSQKALEETHRQNRETIEVTRRGQLTDRFTKAIEQLGQTADDKLDIRLGGIYALEQIAKESKELHRPVMEILTAFLREHSRKPQEASAELAEGEIAASTQPDAASNEEPVPLRADFQAIATVLGRREVSHGPDDFILDLRGVDLGRVDFQRSQLQGAFFAEAQLQNAEFYGAQLRAAVFAKAHLQGARFEDAKLQGAFFQGAELKGASFGNAQLWGASFEAAQLKGAHFSGAQLQNAQFDRAQLQDAVFFGAQLKKAVFPSAQLQKANFAGAQLQNASFSHAQLQDAHFGGAELRGASFEAAQLQKAYFGAAQLQNAYLEHADLEGTDFLHSEIGEHDALGLTPEQFDVALNVDKAILPNYLARARESKRHARRSE